MSLTRRRLFERLVALDDLPFSAEWVSQRGREAGMAPGQADYQAQMTAAGMKPIRIASNENPMGPGQHVLDALVSKFPEAHRYPFNARQSDGSIAEALAAKYKTKTDNIALGAGSGELLTNAVRAFTSPTKPLVTAWPSFENPRDTAKKIGTPVREVGFDSALKIDVAKMIEMSKGAGLVFFCNPNNPTATVHGKTTVADTIKQIRAASPDTVILVDEAYHDYVTDPSYQSAVDIALSTPKVFVARTFSKAYGMAGLRAGYAVGDPATIKELNRFRMPYGLGALVIGGAIVALGNPAHIEAERKRNTDVKAFTVKALADMGFTGTDSQANFLFMNLKRPAAGFRDACRAQGVLVGRDFPPFEKNYCRISIGTMAEMQKAVDVFRKVLASPTTTASKGR